ncbi:MAG: TetR/AcrR family transcriptional regulator [Erythrobacter sp.]|nr:TetR/AcrR family transcriptional regulator [Erythrobacter sp.]
MSEAPRKRGRPPSIDSAAAMQAVVELFRAKGFAAVSLDDLSDATGLSRPSLYRSFGDKLSMYMAAMDAFGAQVEQAAVPALLREGDLKTALSEFYDEMLAIYYRDDSIAAGCLVYGTAPGSADLSAVKSRLFASIEQLDDAMRDRIVRSFPDAEEGIINAAAQIASNTLMAFSARAKSGAPKDELSVMGAQSAHAICTLLEDT